jgi:phosphoribosylanthranilate isomerase
MWEVAALNPDFMGFIFFPPSPRDVSDKIASLPLHELPERIKKVAVLVDMPINDALNLIGRNEFDLVQLHGKETPDFCMKIKKKIPVIKAFSVKNDLPANLDDYTDVCDYFLFDTKADKPGGTGIRFNHDILKQYNKNVPFLLGGGIGPDYFKDSNRFEHPMLYAWDINSRFESSPGIKNIELLKKTLLTI